MRALTAIAALAAALLVPAPLQAATIGLQVEGGGAPQIYRLTSGTFLGLWGFDNRERANPGKGDVTLSGPDDILSGFVSGRQTIVGYYNGPNPVNTGASEFDELLWGFTVADNARLWDSLWIEWTGGNLVFQQPGIGRTTMPALATRDGDPFVTSIPVPMAFPLLLGALGALGLVARVRRPA